MKLSTQQIESVFKDYNTATKVKGCGTVLSYGIKKECVDVLQKINVEKYDKNEILETLTSINIPWTALKDIEEDGLTLDNFKERIVETLEKSKDDKVYMMLVDGKSLITKIPGTEFSFRQKMDAGHIIYKLDEKGEIVPGGDKLVKNNTDGTYYQFSQGGELVETETGKIVIKRVKDFNGTEVIYEGEKNNIIVLLDLKSGIKKEIEVKERYNTTDRMLMLVGRSIVVGGIENKIIDKRTGEIVKGGDIDGRYRGRDFGKRIRGVSKGRVILQSNDPDKGCEFKEVKIQNGLEVNDIGDKVTYDLGFGRQTEIITDGKDKKENKLVIKSFKVDDIERADKMLRYSLDRGLVAKDPFEVFRTSKRRLPVYVDKEELLKGLRDSRDKDIKDLKKVTDKITKEYKLDGEAVIYADYIEGKLHVLSEGYNLKNKDEKLSLNIYVEEEGELEKIRSTRVPWRLGDNSRGRHIYRALRKEGEKYFVTASRFETEQDVTNNYIFELGKDNNKEHCVPTRIFNNEIYLVENEEGTVDIRDIRDIKRGSLQGGNVILEREEGVNIDLVESADNAYISKNTKWGSIVIFGIGKDYQDVERFKQFLLIGKDIKTLEQYKKLKRDLKDCGLKSINRGSMSEGYYYTPNVMHIGKKDDKLILNLINDHSIDTKHKQETYSISLKGDVKECDTSAQAYVRRGTKKEFTYIYPGWGAKDSGDLNISEIDMGSLRLNGINKCIAASLNNSDQEKEKDIVFRGGKVLLKTREELSYSAREADKKKDKEKPKKKSVGFEI